MSLPPPRSRSSGNLTVTVSTACAGVALAVPAAVSVWFNGVVLGAYTRLKVAPAALAAFVAPHGIFELPALVVSGALGLHLGLAWWRTWRRRAGRPYLADELERAFWVLVGVGLLLAVAAAVEGFVSPYYWRPFVRGRTRAAVDRTRCRSPVAGARGSREPGRVPIRMA